MRRNRSQQTKVIVVADQVICGGAQISILKTKELKMKTEKQESLKNEIMNPQAKELVDLPITTEQAQVTKGGRLDQSGHGTHVAGTIGISH
jgi:hypothetical protein